MLKLLWRLVLLIVAGLALVWLAERPGSISIHWQGIDIELSVFVGAMLLIGTFAVLLFVVWLLRRIWRAPSALRGSLKARKEKRAYEALSRGIIAAGAGDVPAAARHAALAGETLKHEPLVHLLSAQVAQLRGDKAEVTRVFEGLSKREDTALLGLRGLHTQARERGDWQAAKHHAEVAHGRSAKLAWAQAGLLHSLAQHKDWQAAAKIVELMGRQGAMAKADATRQQAALLCAAALENESRDAALAMKLATQAHGLDSALVPAALLMARLYTAQGQPKRALKVLRETWHKFPHRELAAAAADAYADGAEEKFERVRELIGNNPAESEGRYALARAAVAAQRHEAARGLLGLDLAEPSPSLCALMAEIEQAAGDHSKARSWLARGLSAGADPCWMANGVALAAWSAVSPSSGELVACQWARPQSRPAAELAFQPEAKAEINALASGLSALPRPPDDPGVE